MQKIEHIILRQPSTLANGHGLRLTVEAPMAPRRRTNLVQSNRAYVDMISVAPDLLAGVTISISTYLPFILRSATIAYLR